MGQVAVAAGYRGQRVFDRMYAKLREAYMDRYGFVATEVFKGLIMSFFLRSGFGNFIQNSRQNGMLITFFEPRTR